MKHLPVALALAVLLSVPSLALARQESTGSEEPLPEWDQLSREQRSILITPVRDQWNLNPKERARILKHAERWKSMSADEREQAEQGRRRFEQLTPEQRQRARSLYHITKHWTEEERQRFNEKWKRLSDEQQDEWIRRHSPREDRSDRDGDRR